jgi:hypothetical protein
MGVVAAVGYGGGRVAVGCGRVVVVERWRPPLAGAQWRSGGGGRGHAVAATGGGWQAAGTHGGQAARRVPVGGLDLEWHGSTPPCSDLELRGSTGAQT